jgi:hypothetical protein
MNMKKIKYIAVMILTIFIGQACQEEGRLDHIDNSAPAPGPVTVGNIESKPGGAVIKYRVPNDENLMKVRAVYVRNGETCQTEASFYTDSLTIEGFGDTQTYEVNLYSVGRNEKLSAPVKVEITPLTPPVQTVTLDMTSGFGGVNVYFDDNTSRADLAFVLMADTAGVWFPLQTFYAKAPKGLFNRREMRSIEYKCALFARDRWNNKSDTLIKIIVPIAEEKLPKDTWTNAKLTGDTYEPVEGNYTWYDLSHLWDGYENTQDYLTRAWFTTYTAPMPQHYTISLGYKAKLSRFQIWPRGPVNYSGANPRTLEIWGSDNPPTDGGWDNWFLLGSFEAFKPSGYADDGSVGPVTAEDIDYLGNHQQYDFFPTDEITDPYRVISYIRVRTTATFTTYGTEAIAGIVGYNEITFWGTREE